LQHIKDDCSDNASISTQDNTELDTSSLFGSRAASDAGGSKRESQKTTPRQLPHGAVERPLPLHFRTLIGGDHQVVVDLGHVEIPKRRQERAPKKRPAAVRAEPRASMSPVHRRSAPSFGFGSPTRANNDAIQTLLLSPLTRQPQQTQQVLLPPTAMHTDSSPTFSQQSPSWGRDLAMATPFVTPMHMHGQTQAGMFPGAFFGTPGQSPMRRPGMQGCGFHPDLDYQQNFMGGTPSESPIRQHGYHDGGISFPKMATCQEGSALGWDSSPMAMPAPMPRQFSPEELAAALRAAMPDHYDD